MITIVDYGVGNIGSVLNMIRKVGGQAHASSQPQELVRAEKIILPGVGSFDHAMMKLVESGMAQPLMERAAAGVPILGICLGMQLLSQGSEEGTRPGLGLIPGHIRRFRFDATQPALKVPHMGWNRVRGIKHSPLIAGVDDAFKFYFVHSFYYECENPADELLQSQYGRAFTSGVQKDNVMGVQFHPEKSHRYGMRILKNFIDLPSCSQKE